MANFALAKRLAECGVRVEIVAHRVETALAGHSNVSWTKVPKPLDAYMLGAPLLDYVGRRQARRTMNSGGRVLVNGGNCQVADVNWVHYVHAAYDPTDTATTLVARAKGRLLRSRALAQEAAALRSARLVLVNSERTRRDLVELLGISDSVIVTVYYGIDSDRFRPVSEEQRRAVRRRLGWPDRPTLAFIGALGDRRKGFDTLFDAWTRLCASSNWDADLIVIGHGAELAAWQQRAIGAGIAERIRFLGFCSNVPELLAACDALVAPTRYEAFGLGVLEALCTGLPAIVSASAGVAEYYPDNMQRLLLTDPNSANELQSRLETWRGDLEPLRAATLDLATRARQRTWAVMADEIRSVIWNRFDR